MRDQEDCPKKVRRRGERAYQRMFSANLRLVANVAKKYQHIAKSLELEDLLQEGCIGLARAVEKLTQLGATSFRPAIGGSVSR